jgi:2-keto-4-pentenoate hydratase/2-oxohepta-3-ene-1,7-dioic acid hydratase in catechol pathway
MKFARYQAGESVEYGIVEGETVTRITAAPWGDYETTTDVRPVSSVRLLAPAEPSKMVAIGLNYRSHLGDREAPKVPEPFLKTPSSVIGPGDPIVLPAESEVVQEEAELAVVFGKRCRRASRVDALSYVLGYTCANDVSERGWQAGDLQWWRAKSADTFGPIGPIIVTDLDPANLAIEARVNGEVVQKSNTADLLYDIPAIIEWVSRVMTLEPGDVILTGTPGTTATISPGDTVEIELEGVGVLSNPVRDE